MMIKEVDMCDDDGIHLKESLKTKVYVSVMKKNIP